MILACELANREKGRETASPETPKSNKHRPVMSSLLNLLSASGSNLIAVRSLSCGQPLEALAGIPA